jgi:putative salt-induced outer membrane protein YdiY
MSYQNSRFLRQCFAAAAAAILICFSLPSLQAQEEDTDEDPGHFFQNWDGRIELGYTYQSGRTDRNELTLRAQADREAGIHKFRAIAEYVYGEQKTDAGTVKSSDRYGASFRWRRTLSQYFYTQSLTSYEVDQIRRIKQRAEQNLSLGYQFLDRENIDASVGPGFTAQYNRQIGVETGMNYLATFFQDVNWQITEAYRFEEDSTFLIEPEDTDNYIYRFNAGLVGTMTQSINLSLRYSLIYENQVAPDVERAEHRVVAALGYTF